MGGAARGPDLDIVRKVWETEQLRRWPPRSTVDDPRDIDALAGVSDRAQAIRKLITALRTLHVRAGQPTPQQICVYSRWRLQAHQVAAILERDEPCDWPTLVLLMTLFEIGSGSSSVNPQVSGQNAGLFRQRTSCRGEQDG